jgi:hypothetical protein
MTRLWGDKLHIAAGVTALARELEPIWESEAQIRDFAPNLRADFDKPLFRAIISVHGFHKTV